MSQDESSGDFISVKDMRSAMDREVREVMKAAQLRIREFTKFTNAYTAGEITPAEATDKCMHYMDKWGDPLPGVMAASEKLTDEEIVAHMERAMRPHASRVQTRRSRPQTGTEKD